MLLKFLKILQGVFKLLKISLAFGWLPRRTFKMEQHLITKISVRILHFSEIFSIIFDILNNFNAIFGKITPNFRDYTYSKSLSRPSKHGPPNIWRTPQPKNPASITGLSLSSLRFYQTENALAILKIKDCSGLYRPRPPKLENTPKPGATPPQKKKKTNHKNFGRFQRCIK